MLVYALFSFIQGTLYKNLGPKLVVTIGSICVVIGVFLLTQIPQEFSYYSLILGMVVIGLGMGLFLSPNMTAAISSVDPSRSSLAGGLILMFQIAGGAMGLGLTTTFFVSASHSALNSDFAKIGLNLSPQELNLVEEVLSGTKSSQELLGQFGYENISRITSSVHDAFVSGIKSGFLLDAALAFIGFLIVFLFCWRKI